MPYKDPLVRNARQRERYSKDLEFRLRHYESARKWNRGRRVKSIYKPRPNKQKRIVNYRRMLINLLKDRDGNACRFCLSTFSIVDKVVIDHIIAVADGGTDEGSNLQLVHRHCNSTKEAEAVYKRTVTKIKLRMTS